MINETALRDALSALTEIAKRQLELIVAEMAELSAIRETVRGLDPTFADTLAAKRQQASQNVLPLMKHTVVRLDELTRKLKAGEVC
jgi:hypothetical protein